MIKKMSAASAALTPLSGSGADTPEVRIDYGTTGIYTRDDMDAAIEAVKAAFADFKGCGLHALRYADDTCSSAENLAWMNSLGKHGPYAQCICFNSDFRSPKNGGGAWTPDTEYTDWDWWLARTEGGAWEVLTGGYC